MVSVTLSIPKETKELMNRFPEINWSGFIRTSIEKKAKQLSWKEEMLEKLNQDREFEDWAVDMGRKVNAGIAKRVK
ncbi:MAG: hypothetical protein ABH879_04155 [archaeon]